MIKKILCLIAGVLVFCNYAFAGGIINKIVDATLNDTVTLITSGTLAVSDDRKIAFFVDYDETEVGGGVSGVFSIDISHDGTTWVDAAFHDFAGGATLQTGETMTADTNYYCWFEIDWNMPFLRTSFLGSGTDTDDTIDIEIRAVRHQ